jgi:hypothetical protein
VTLPPQSPPTAKKRWYPKRCIKSAHASAVRSTVHPELRGLSLNPKPGREGATTWNAGASGDRGLVSSSMTASGSMTELGQP